MVRGSKGSSSRSFHRLHRDLSRRPHSGWSLSPLTLPHELARVVVAEQLYRALTLLRGLPYHK